jgi:thiol-disulfide isomerase/thioredoxin
VSFLLLAVLLQSPAPAASQSPEARIVQYLQTNVKPGQRVVVSELYNNVFTTEEERAALNRLFNAFFKIPLFVAQQTKASGKAPTLQEIAEQFHFQVPGQADVMLRIMESDPRVPKFLERDAKSGEIVRVDVDAILASPRYGKALERTITGWEGKPAPAFQVATYDGKTVDSASLAGKPYLLYFWFTNCPPCLKTSPLLAELDKAYAGKGLQIVGINADKVLELPYKDEDRAAYAKKTGMGFTLAHLAPEVQQAYGTVSVFPTMFFVDRKGTVVRHFVNFHEKAALEEAVKLALQP